MYRLRQPAHGHSPVMSHVKDPSILDVILLTKLLPERSVLPANRKAPNPPLQKPGTAAEKFRWTPSEAAIWSRRLVNPTPRPQAEFDRYAGGYDGTSYPC